MENKIQLLVVAAKNGSQSAITKLYNKFYPLLVSVVKKRLSGYRDPQIVEDIAQEAMIKAFASIKNYQPTKNFGSWLTRIAFNLMIDNARKMKKAELSSIEGAIDISQKGDADNVSIQLVDEHPLPDISMIDDETKHQIREIIVNTLNKSLYEIVDMRYFQEMSYQEIAKALDIPMGTMQARLFRAHTTLKTSSLASY